MSHQYAVVENTKNNMVKDVLALLKQANEKGIVISYDDNKLVVSIADDSQIDESFLKELKSAKSDLINYFSNHEDSEPIPSIKTANRSDYVPLSFSQQSLWFLDKLQGGSLEYHVPLILRFEGILDIKCLENSFQNVINRHEVLRTIYLEDENGIGYQKVIDEGKWSLKQLNFENNHVQINSFIRAELNTPFDLSSDHMVRATLINKGLNEHILVLVTHHIASDGWSSAIFINELVAYYQYLNDGVALSLPPLEIQYSDYAIWQRGYLQGEILQKKLSYWKEKLKGTVGVDFPSDYTITMPRTYEGASYKHEIALQTLHDLKNISQKEKTTLFTILLAAFKVLLYRYSGQDDIAISTPTANREQKELEPLIGFFLNPLVIRSNLGGTPSFRDLLLQVKQTLLDAYRHQDIPYEKVIDIIEDGRDLSSRSSIQDIVFVLQNNEEAKVVELDGLRLSREPISEIKVDFNLHFNAQETEKGIDFIVTYSKELYAPETISRLMAHYENIINSINQNPTAKINELEMLTSEDLTLLETFNETKIDYQNDLTIVDLFEEQVSKTPDNIALVFNGLEFTYKELNEKANRLAHYLRKEYDIRPDDLVGVMMNRSEWAIISILGILKSGGAYVPIDIDYPVSRKKFIIEESEIEVLIVKSESLFDIVDFDTKIISIDIEFENIPKKELKFEQFKRTITSSNLVYVIYTSGSTGNPKGIKVEHRNLVNMILDQRDRLSVTENDCVSQFISLSFDVSASEIFTSLISGSRLLLLSKSLITNGENFVSYLKENEVSIAHIPPSFLISLDIEQLAFIRVLKVGGEAINMDIVLECAKNSDVYNEYGPTECTICSTIHKVDFSDRDRKQLPIGKPIASTEIFILGANEELLPVGIVGELCIGGMGVSRGYLNRNQLTNEKFIENPYKPGERIYKTGDLARWLLDGSLDFIGRKDYQVKIRGNRIELGEIEIILQSTPNIIQGVVVVRESELLGKRLVAYITVEDAYEKVATQKYLEERLPIYMVPSLLVVLETMPLNLSGKIDRKQLPDDDMVESKSADYKIPETELEVALTTLWEGLLGVSKIGIDDNFFELGGDSIITIQLVSRAKREGYYFTPKEVFENQTIRSLAHFLENQSGNDMQTEQGLLEGVFEMIPIQQWFFDVEFPEMAHYNQSLLLEIKKNISKEQLNTIVEALVAHHDVFRLIFEKKEEKWEQYYSVQDGELVYENLQGIAKEKLSDKITEVCTYYQQSLELESGDLIRFVFLETSDEESNNRLLIVAHHLLIDAVSWRILLDDIGECLTRITKGEEIDLGKKGSSYRQFHTALSKYAQSDAMESQITYWETVASGLVNIPLDITVNEPSTLRDVFHYEVSLDKDTTNSLIQETSQAYNTEINDLLISALAVSVSEHFKMSKIMIGLEGHGREDIFNTIDVSGTIGWFTSFYPVQIDVSNVLGTADLIKSTKEQLRLIPDKGMGYGVLRYFHPSTTLRNTLSEIPWDIGFNYLGQFDNAMTGGANKWLKGASESAGESLSKQTPFRTRLEINCSISGGHLNVSFGYSQKEFLPETISKIAERYMRKLETIIKHCKEQEEVKFTPADYGLNGKLDYKELDEFFEEDKTEGDQIFKF